VALDASLRPIRGTKAPRRRYAAAGEGQARLI